MILSRFSGIAKFHNSSGNLGFSNHQISLLQDKVASLHLVATKILEHATGELEMFNAFSAWLRFEIDRLASEDSSINDEESLHKESTLDYSKTLQYIQTCLTSSPLAYYLAKITDDENDTADTGVEHGVSIFETLTKQIHRKDKDQQYLKRLPQQGFLIHKLSQQADLLFKQIADSEKRNILIRDCHRIGYRDGMTCLDMKMVETVS